MGGCLALLVLQVFSALNFVFLRRAFRGQLLRQHKPKNRLYLRFGFETNLAAHFLYQRFSDMQAQTRTLDGARICSCGLRKAAKNMRVKLWRNTAASVANFNPPHQALMGSVGAMGTNGYHDTLICR